MANIAPISASSRISLGQRGKDHLNAVCLGDRRYGLHNQLQRQQNQPKTNTDAAQLPGA
ncbi:hypothetical protein ACOI4F_12860 [Escherichia coli]